MATTLGLDDKLITETDKSEPCKSGNTTPCFATMRRGKPAIVSPVERSYACRHGVRVENLHSPG